ncbi:MAG: S24 family peptidase [Clostridium sp.]|nr:S24 family peptidase [Clostridium sp.]
MQPLNPEYQPMVYTNEQIKTLPVKIIGRVVELRRKK